jgi:hypothetical protein
MQLYAAAAPAYAVSIEGADVQLGFGGLVLL